MPTTYDRRTFLTHSAATVGGVAMAGTVVDTMISDAAGAASLPHITRGATLNVAIGSDSTHPSKFSGQTGKLDAAGFYTAAAVFDGLFGINATANAIVPSLGLSATHNANYTVWTFQLRQNVKFHSGGTFNAAAVVANYQAAKHDATVGAAIAPIISGVAATGPYTVQYTTFFPFATFPIALAEQQIGFMADPVMFAPNPASPSTYTWTGLPSGTGAFKASSWTPGITSTWVANANYWRQDSTGAKLPYLGKVTFKVLVDPSARLNALKSGGVNIAPFADGNSIKSIKSGSVSSGGHPVVHVDDKLGLREPSKNMILVNTTGKDFLGRTGTQSTTSHPDATMTVIFGTPTSSFWNPSASVTTPVADITLRQAMAFALNRALYASGIDQNQTVVSDGIFRPSNVAFYSNPGYPAFNMTTAKAKVNTWKAAHSGHTPSVRMQYVKGSTYSTNVYLFVKSALNTAGITVTGVPVVQSDLILNAIYKQYELSQWAQFGAIVPGTNYVWWDAPPPTYTPGFVNFANNKDPLVENAMRSALAQPTASLQKPYWTTVNKRFAIDLPYLWLDVTVTLWAAQSTVQNWQLPKGATGASVKSTVSALSVANGSFPDWAGVWK